MLCHPHAVSMAVLSDVQAYVVCELPEKLNVLWAFVKSHLKASICFSLGPQQRP
jgi:ATP-dependent RNA helicase DDX10/DBP4